MGGGAIGVATAYEILLAGASVTLLERGHALASGCSSGNTSHTSPLATPAAVRQALRWSLSKSSPFYVHPRPAVLPWLLCFVVANHGPRVAAATETLRALSLAGLGLHAAYVHAGILTKRQCPPRCTAHPMLMATTALFDCDCAMFGCTADSGLDKLDTASTIRKCRVAHPLALHR
jgi:hypothetical protein